MGQIGIAGSGVARGYINRPNLTSDKFTSSATGERLYLVGDVGRSSADGRLRCLGRIDHQVKVRGYRIELGEIESRLVEHPAVQAAAVTVWTKDSGDSQLAAYVVPASAAQEQGALREFLGVRLPDYMVPSAF